MAKKIHTALVKKGDLHVELNISYPILT